MYIVRNGKCVTPVCNRGIKLITEKCVTVDELTIMKTKVLNVVVMYSCCFVSQYLYP